ncbi:MAG: NhaA family Na+:H+ antiporter [Gammaproteobacteria bacterium]|jgi:NhaA family Na+:H+ antiporter
MTLTTYKNRLLKALHHESAGGIVLVAMAALALIFSNSFLEPAYSGFLAIPVEIRFGDFSIAKPTVLWINDGLMAIFFFLVGLEIKREVMEGDLSSISKATLPGLAAIAGVAVPALIYWQLNKDNPIASQGWAIPSATDIAFALGVLSLFGDKIPTSLKVFLLAVAIFDDLMAVMIIAIFYSTNISVTSLAIASAGLVVLFAFNRLNVNRLAAYIIVGVIIWASVLKSGVHATLAGFLIALFIPLHTKNQHGQPMLPTLESALHPWSAFLILPLFAFANAGVTLTGINLDNILTPVSVGIALGLFLGKQFGIFGICWLAIKSGIAERPKDASWLQIYAVSILCGIGFTMSLFIGSLAFENVDGQYTTNVKLGVILGSLASAILGGTLLHLSTKRKHKAVVL